MIIFYCKEIRNILCRYLIYMTKNRGRLYTKINAKSSAKSQSSVRKLMASVYQIYFDVGYDVSCILVGRVTGMCIVLLFPAWSPWILQIVEKWVNNGIRARRVNGNVQLFSACSIYYSIHVHVQSRLSFIIYQSAICSLLIGLRFVQFWSSIESFATWLLLNKYMSLRPWNI